MQIWFTNKFINRAQFHIFSHSLQFMGTINTYQKPLSIQLHLLWRIPRLSLVSKLYLNLCFWYLIFSFLLGSDRLLLLTLPLWCIQILLLLPFYLIYITPTSLIPCVYYRGGTFLSNGILKIVFLRERWQSEQRM